jgi:hypothetical protein
MKLIKITLLSALLLICSSTFAQELKLKMPTATKECTSFNWKNGEGVYVAVEFQYYIKDDEVAVKLTDKQFSEAVMSTMIKSKFTCKNKISFVPRQMMIMSDKEKIGYTIIVTMWAYNSYGAKSEHKANFTLDSIGNITSQF